MLGNVPRMSVLDSTGLTDREVAEWRARDEGLEDGDPLWKRFAVAARRPAAVRAVDWSCMLTRPVYPPLTRYYPDTIEQLYPYTESFKCGRGTIEWRRASPNGPSQAVIVSRWLELRKRYPSQPFFTKQLADALREAGHADRAAAVLLEGARRWPRLRGYW
jgi:hypothetical protein